MESVLESQSDLCESIELGIVHIGCWKQSESLGLQVGLVESTLATGSDERRAKPASRTH